MSSGERAGARRQERGTRTDQRWTCRYCGRRFAPESRSREAYDLLVAHIRNDCPDVPPTVRARYRDRCAGKNCRM